MPRKRNISSSPSFPGLRRNNSNNNNNNGTSSSIVVSFFVTLVGLFLWLAVENVRILSSSPWSTENHGALSSSLPKQRRFPKRNANLMSPDRSDDDCQPFGIHLSPASNVVDSKVNMTVSFLLPDRPECGPSQLTPILWYGQYDYDNDSTTTRSVLSSSSNSNGNSIGSTHPSANTTVPSESFQLTYTNYLKSFTSSWIHHATLPNLQAGNQLHWYFVEVHPKNKDKNKSSNSNNNSNDEQNFRKRTTNKNAQDDDIPSHTMPNTVAAAAALVPTITRRWNFTTPPLPTDPVRIAMIADWGGSKEALQTMQGMIQASRRNTRKQLRQRRQDTEEPLPVDLPPLSAVLVAGDISYANSYLPGWEDWLVAMQPLYASTPLLVAAGNHELECNRQTWQVFQAYEGYFRVPNRISPAHLEPIPRQVLDCTHPAQFMTVYDYGNSFYSYRHGLLHIVVLNSYTNTTKGSVQYQWLEQELITNIDRTVTPWLLVMFHCPFHTTFRGHNDEQNPKLMMKDMEPLFVQYHVNIVLSGHNHAYVRTVPMRGPRPAVVDGGPVYLTIGTGGDSHSQGPLNPHHPEEWVAHRDNTEYGFGELQVVNRTHAFFQRILNHPQTANPKAYDSVWITTHGTATSPPSTTITTTTTTTHTHPASFAAVPLTTIATAET